MAVTSLLVLWSLFQEFLREVKAIQESLYVLQEFKGRFLVPGSSTFTSDYIRALSLPLVSAPSALVSVGPQTGLLVVECLNDATTQVPLLLL